MKSTLMQVARFLAAKISITIT